MRCGFAFDTRTNDLDFQKICDQTGLDAIINKGYLTLLLDVKLKESSNESICATAQWLHDNGHKNICFICEDHRIVYMIAMTNIPTSNEIHDLEEHLQTNYISYKAGAAYGDRAHGIRNVYKNADFALKYIEFMKLDSRVVCYHQLNPGTCLTQQHFGRLYEAYQRKQLNSFKQTLDELFADFMSNTIAPDAAANALVETWRVHKIDLSFLRKLTSLNAMHASLLSFFTPSIQDNATKGLPESVMAIILYIEEHYAEPIDLNTAASNLNLSYAYTSTLFKKSMGLSFSQYVNRYRMQKAVELLDHTNCFVYEVAEKVGFESNKYFFKKFKEKHNMTPNEYQRRSIHRGLELDA